MFIDFTGIVAIVCLLLGSRLRFVGVSRERGGLPISSSAGSINPIVRKSVRRRQGFCFLYALAAAACAL